MNIQKMTTRTNDTTSSQKHKGIVIAIGGGHIGGDFFDPQNHSCTTTGIDRKIIAMARERKPEGTLNVLFIPTALQDDSSYCDAFKGHYKCLDKDLSVSNLLLYSNPSQDAIKEAVKQADVIYVGGGSSVKMLEKWKEVGLLPILKQAHNDGKILSGLSAGANCWFRWFGTDSYVSQEESVDSKKFKEKFAVLENPDFLFDMAICPHYTNGNPWQSHAFHDKFKDVCKVAGRVVAYGVDENAALVFVDEQFSTVIASTPNAHAYTIQLEKEYTFGQDIKHDTIISTQLPVVLINHDDPLPSQPRTKTKEHQS